MKTETKVTHTPGPWEIRKMVGGRINLNHGFIINSPSTSRRIASVKSHDDGEDEANARLIAAAPELSKASKALLLRLDLMGKEGRGNEVLLLSERLALKAAIAKAEGEINA